MYRVEYEVMMRTGYPEVRVMYADDCDELDEMLDRFNDHGYVIVDISRYEYEN